MERGEEEIDAENFKNLVAAMQVEINTLRANQKNVAQTMLVKKWEIERQKLELEERQAEVERRQREATITLEAAV